MKPNLKQYRINTTKEAAEYKAAGGDEFKRYFSAVRTFLDGMNDNQVFDICAHIPEHMHKSFVKATCIYIIDYSFGEVEFTDDYLFVRKRKLF